MPAKRKPAKETASPAVETPPPAVPLAALAALDTLAPPDLAPAPAPANPLAGLGAVDEFLTNLDQDRWRLDVKSARLLRVALAGDRPAAAALLERLALITDHPAELRQACAELRSRLP